MSLRPARTTDAFGMVDLLVEQHSRSRYLHAGAIDTLFARKLLAQAVQRNGGTTAGSTLVNVIEGDDGNVVAFMLGVLDRVYHIGSKLCAQDMFLVATPKVGARASSQLLAAYIDWASSNPAVHEIMLSHTDALPEGDRMGAVYERLGFERCGGIYRKVVA